MVVVVGMCACELLILQIGLSYFFDLLVDYDYDCEKVYKISRSDF